MLYDQRRKRGRQAMAVAPRPPPTTAPTAINMTARVTHPPPLVRAHAATQRFLEALPHHSRQQPVWTATGQARTTTATTGPTVASAPEGVSKMIRQAHRVRKLLLDRLTVVNLRRSHRCELLEEIARLKKVLASLQDQVDSTTRNVARMDRLVQHLQSISSIFTDAIEGPAAATAAPVARTLEAAEKEEERASESSQSPRVAKPLPMVVADDVQVVELIDDELETKAEQLQVEDSELSAKKSVNEPVEKADAADGVEVSNREGEGQPTEEEEVTAA